MNEMTTEMESLKIRLKATWMAGQRFPMLMMLPGFLLETKDRHPKSGNSKSNPSQAHSTWGSHIQLIEKAQKLKKGIKLDWPSSNKRRVLQKARRGYGGDQNYPGR